MCPASVAGSPSHGVCAFLRESQLLWDVCGLWVPFTRWLSGHTPKRKLDRPSPFECESEPAFCCPKTLSFVFHLPSSSSSFSFSSSLCLSAAEAKLRSKSSYGDLSLSLSLWICLLFKQSLTSAHRFLLLLSFVFLLLPLSTPSSSLDSFLRLCLQADVDETAASGLQPKKRTFKKFSFRGVDLDALLDMSSEELVELFHARARRRLSFCSRLYH